MTHDRYGFERWNRAPIFLNCLSRGGSNIFWNLFLSHPDVCSPIRETLEIFRADHRAPTLAGLWLALFSAQPRFFDQWKLAPRRELHGPAARFVDRKLQREKLRTLDDEEMCFRSPGRRYARSEVESARLGAKNNNGLVFLTEPLRELYPDATFFALVREPVALYESHRRRGLHSSPDAFCDFYQRVVGKMLADRDRFDSCHLVRFEDVLADPVGVFRQVCRDASLDPDAVSHLRFKSKEHFLPDGSRGAEWQVGRHRWFRLDEVESVFVRDVNEIQAHRLEAEEREQVQERTAELCRRLGYDR